MMFLLSLVYASHVSHLPFLTLVDLLVRKPFTGLQILLLERRIQNAQPSYLARRGRVVALDVGLLLAVRGLQGGNACSLVWNISGELLGREAGRTLGIGGFDAKGPGTHLFLVVQTLVVVL
jgi:hypothetical protein